MSYDALFAEVIVASIASPARPVVRLVEVRTAASTGALVSSAITCPAYDNDCDYDDDCDDNDEYEYDEYDDDCDDDDDNEYDDDCDDHDDDNNLQLTLINRHNNKKKSSKYLPELL